MSLAHGQFVAEHLHAMRRWIFEYDPALVNPGEGEQENRGNVAALTAEPAAVRRQAQGE